MSEDMAVQILRAINEFREENNKRWEQNEKRWEENDRRWEENERRWEENDRRWEENEKRWDRLYRKLNKDKEDIEEILWSFQTSTESMYKSNLQRIERLEKAIL